MFLFSDTLNTYLENARLDSDFGRIFIMVSLMILITIMIKVFDGSNQLVFLIVSFALIVAMGIGFLPLWFALLMFLIYILLIYTKIRSGFNG